MSDLLGYLRDFTIHNKEIKEEGDEITFNNYAWPKETKTNYVIWGTDKNGCTKEYYPLESLTYFLKNINLSHAQLVRQSAASNIFCIRLPDRQKLMDYLHGKISTCESIDLSVPIDTSKRRLIVPVITTEPEIDEPPIKQMRLEDVIDHQRLAAKLDQPAGGKPATMTELTQSDASQISTLPEHISVDKIQMLRAKFRANHQQTIKPDENDRPIDGEENQVTVPEPESKSIQFSSTKLQLAQSKSVVMEIVAREYTWRTRTTVLQSLKKTFFDSVVQGTLRNVKMREENLGSSWPVSKETATHGKAPMTQNQQQPMAHYSRYDQERFAGPAQDTAGFKIDTMGSYHGKGLSSMMTGEAGSTTGASRDPRAQKPASSSASRQTASDSGKSPRSSTGVIAGSKSKSRVPIIIIPAATTSLITMLNCRDILQDLRYLSTEHKRSAGCRRDNEVLIQRPKPDGRTVPYRIVDQPNKLSADEWDRVVAVFVQGPAWQFKNWPLGNGPMEIFSVVKAFHLKESNMPLHPDVGKWNVHVVQLDSRRHLDKANFQQVWEILDRHMIKMKPHLRF